MMPALVSADAFSFVKGKRAVPLVGAIITVERTITMSYNLCPWFTYLNTEANKKSDLLSRASEEDCAQFIARWGASRNFLPSDLESEDGFWELFHSRAPFLQSDMEVSETDLNALNVPEWSSPVRVGGGAPSEWVTGSNHVRQSRLEPCRLEPCRIWLWIWFMVVLGLLYLHSF